MSPAYVPCRPEGPVPGDTDIANRLRPQMNGPRLGRNINGNSICCARVITNTVRERGLDPRAAVIALSTAIAESTLHNYTQAVDHDSLGLFQQRPSMGWGTPAQLTDPVYATNAFINAMLRKYPNNGWMRGDIGAICQRIQVSAVPDAYGHEVHDAELIVNAVWSGTRMKSRVFAGDAGVIYGVQANGDLIWYRHLDPVGGANTWSDGNGAKIGSGWNTFTSITANGQGVIYAVQSNGDLMWYRHLDAAAGQATWANGVGARIGTGWGAFTSVFAGDGGVLYGINPNGDLMWYRHLDAVAGQPTWADGVGARIGSGWGAFKNVFSGGDGIIYAINPNGDLLWYRHLDPNGGAATWADGVGAKIGTGWGSFISTFSMGDGIIYAIASNGDLFWYRHLDPTGGTTTWANDHGIKIGSGWNVFS